MAGSHGKSGVFHDQNRIHVTYSGRRARRAVDGWLQPAFAGHRHRYWRWRRPPWRHALPAGTGKEGQLLIASPLSDRSPKASGPIAFSSAVSLSLSGWPCKRQRTLASRYFTASAARPISETAVGSFPILLLPRLPNIPLIWQVDTLLPRLVAVRARLGAATRHCLHRQNNNKNN